MSETKETNPKASFGAAKPPPSVVPMPVLYEVGLALLEGHMKGYRSHNYRVAGCRASTYFDALTRHVTAWWEGEDIDPLSGLPHLVKAAACIFVLRDAEILGIVTDDRPPKHEDGWQDKYAKHVARLKEQFPEWESVEPYTQVGELKKTGETPVYRKQQ